VVEYYHLNIGACFTMDKKKYNLFLDDDPNRIPHKLTWIELPLVEWVIVRNYNDFVETILRDGMPEIISFDHDLADEHYKEFFTTQDERREIDYSKLSERTGYHCAKWLASYCIESDTPIPQYYIHTLNPAGHMNILSILECAKRVMNKSKDDAKVEV